jgi:hypothetical protein
MYTENENTHDLYTIVEERERRKTHDYTKSQVTRDEENSSDTLTDWEHYDTLWSVCC